MLFFPHFVTLSSLHPLSLQLFFYLYSHCHITFTSALTLIVTSPSPLILLSLSHPSWNLGSSRRRIFEAEVVEDGSDEEFEGFLESKNEEGSRERERGGGDYIDGDVAHKAVGKYKARSILLIGGK